MFDLGADPALIAEQLSGDVLLRRAAAAHAGIRTPGAWDPFEITVRAILGQQISVKAATTIAGRIAGRWGTSIGPTGQQANGPTALNRLFPTPDQLADAPLEEAGITSSRARTLRALARAVRDGGIVFNGVSTLEALRAIPGIGEWTAQYVAMRALNEPDALPVGRSGAEADGRRLQRARARAPQRGVAALARLRGDAVVAGGEGSRSTDSEDSTCARGLTSAGSGC